MKKALLIFLFITLFAAIKSQSISWPFTIPNPIPEHNAPIVPPSASHFYYPNLGQVRMDDSLETLADNVAWYTQFARPQKYILNNCDMSFVMYKPKDISGSGKDSVHRIDMEHVGINTTAYTARLDTQSNSILNYFLGQLGSNIVDVRGSAGVAAQNIYPKIDLVYFSNAAGVKIFYIVWPGGNPLDIELNFAGAKSTAIVNDELQIEGNFEGFKFDNPLAYQYTYANNTVNTFTTSGSLWSHISGNKYHIEPGDYDPHLPLILQVRQGAVTIPTAIGNISWSTYFGGNGRDYILKSNCDTKRNLFMCGAVTSNNFPFAQGSNPSNPNPSQGTDFDGMLSKFDTAGVLKWVNYVGGDREDRITNFDFRADSIYAVGYTYSGNLLIKPKSGAYNDAVFHGPLNHPQMGLCSDGFIFQINQDGANNKWLTYFGGDGVDGLSDVKFDSNGNMYVVGLSNSTDMTLVGTGSAYQQTFNSAQSSQSGSGFVSDAIIARFANNSMNMNWFTFYGTDTIAPTDTSGVCYDNFNSLVIEPGNSGNIYVVGNSGGYNMPLKTNNRIKKSGFEEGIIVKFNHNAALQASYFTHTRNNVDVKLNPVFNFVMVCGIADSDMPVTCSGIYSCRNVCDTLTDGMFMMIHTDLSGPAHASFIGGDGAVDGALDMEVGATGIVFIGGGTGSLTYPISTATAGIYTQAQSGPADREDNFLTMLVPNMTNPAWNTCLGTNTYETFTTREAVSIAYDGKNVYLCGHTGSLNNFPKDAWYGFPTYYQPQSGGFGSDGTITRFSLAPLYKYWVGQNEIIATENSLRVFPNPSNHQLTVKSEKFQNENLHYQIYNLVGQEMLKGDYKINEQIDVSGLSNGVYIIIVNNKHQQFSTKFIKTNE